MSHRLSSRKEDPLAQPDTTRTAGGPTGWAVFAGVFFAALAAIGEIGVVTPGTVRRDRLRVASSWVG